LKSRACENDHLAFNADLEARNVRFINIILSMIEESKLLISENLTLNVIHDGHIEFPYCMMIFMRKSTINF